MNFGIYRVTYTHIKADGTRSRDEYDTVFAKSCQSAVEQIREDYSYLNSLRIERVHKDLSNHWVEINAWD